MGLQGCVFVRAPISAVKFLTGSRVQAGTDVDESIASPFGDLPIVQGMFKLAVQAHQGLR